MSGGNQPVAGAQARALGNQPDASVGTIGQYPPRSEAIDTEQRSVAERSTVTDGPTSAARACPPSSGAIAAALHQCSNVALDRSHVPYPVPGPQFLVRAQSMRPVAGRPEATDDDAPIVTVPPLGIVIVPGPERDPLTTTSDRSTPLPDGVKAELIWI